MSQSGFTLPLVLAVMLIIAASLLSMLQEQLTVAKYLVKSAEANKRVDQRAQLNLVSLPETKNPWLNVDKKLIALDGLYNVNHLVETSALGKRQVNALEKQKFQKLISFCGLPSDIADTIILHLISGKTPSEKYSTLDLLADIHISPQDIPNALTCFRIASPLQKINLKTTQPKHVKFLTDLPDDKVKYLMKKISYGEIMNKTQLVAHATDIGSLEYLRRKFRNITVSHNIEHAAVYWNHGSETFAYYEKKFEMEAGWTHLSSIVLWQPELYQ